MSYLSLRSKVKSLMDELENQNTYVQPPRHVETKTSPLLEKYFQPLKQYLQVHQNSQIIHLFIVVGDAGIGKSFTVIQGLKEMGKKEERDYVILNVYSTPLGLYEFLYYNNGKTIICDDISNIFKNEVCKKILLSAMWSASGKRTIRYESKTGKLTAPREFEFTGKIIAIDNSMPEELENIKSRGLLYRVHFTYDERIQIIFEIGRLYNIPPEIPEFIRSKTDETYEINFRLPLILWEIYKAHRDNGWESLALKQLRVNEELGITKECLKQSRSLADAIKMFKERTGLGKSAFHHCCGELVRRGMVEIEIPQ